MVVPLNKRKVFQDRSAWVIKHKTANHETASDFYKSYADAKRDLDTIPRHGDCDGTCAVGCYYDYEIVEVFIVALKGKSTKIKVKSV
jgi:hypothetical protein